MSREFRRVGTLDLPPFECWVRDAETVIFDDKPTDSRVMLTVDKAYRLRDWLNAVLPCPHSGLRRGTVTLGPGGSIKMYCDQCGAEVPSHVGTLGF